MASSALAGRPPILDVNLIAALDSDLAGIFHTGKLKTRKPSTLVRAAEGKLTVVREGSISFKALGAKVPEIEREAIG